MTRVAEGLREENSSFVSFPPARTAVAGQAKSKPTKAPRKVCLLVLAMHRSGASAFARVLNLLGCDLPKSAAQANEAAEGALGESDTIRQFNDRILASAGTRWDDWLEFHPGWLQSPRAEEFREEALELLRQEFGASRLFVLKDSRMCRLVPFWLGVFKAAGVQPLILSPVRSPLAVAAALEQRDGLSPGLGHLMWLRHVLDAEFASRGTKRFFTSYDQLTSGWAHTTTAASSTLGIAWPRLSDRAAVEIETFLSNDCRDDRQQVGNGLDNPTLSDWLRSTSEILGRWSVEDETPQDYAKLDEIRMAMNTAAPAFSRLLGTEQARSARLEMELASERQQALQLRSELESRAEAAEQELASERQQALQLRSELESRAEAAEQELASERQQALQLRSELESRAEGAEQELASERQRQEQAAAEAEKSLAELRHRLAQTESALAQRSHESEQTAGELAAAREELRQTGAARAAAEAARAEAEKVSAGLKQHLDVLLADVKQRQMLVAEQADTDASLARQVKQVLAVLETSRHELAIRLSEAEKVRVTQAAELQQRLDEIETLKRTVEETQSELHQQRSEAERLRQVAALEIGRAAGLVNGKGTSTLRRRFRLMWRAALLRRSGLFDAQWYLRHNADVADAGIDPLRHYVEFGASEGRAPNPGLMASNDKALAFPPASPST
jgi:hypothetical protein